MFMRYVFNVNTLERPNYHFYILFRFSHNPAYFPHNQSISLHISPKISAYFLIFFRILSDGLNKVLLNNILIRKKPLFSLLSTHVYILQCMTAKLV